MARSKRSKPVTLSKVKRKDRSRKEKLLTEIRDTLENHNYVHVFEVENSRSLPLQEVRMVLKPGRMFYGKNKVMMTALGLAESSEVANNIHKVAMALKGHRGLLITDMGPEQVKDKDSGGEWCDFLFNSNIMAVVFVGDGNVKLRVFDGCQPEEFARCGFVATETVVLKEGSDALAQFPHSMEPQLRQLGLPTLLKDGTIYLMGDATVCTEGSELTVEAAQLLKLMGIRMARFRINLIASWDKKTSNVTTYKE